MTLNVKKITEFTVNMCAQTMMHAAQRNAWSIVEHCLLVIDTAIAGYEKSIGATRS